MDDSTVTSGWSLRRRLAQVLVSTALLPVLLFSAALLWSQWQGDKGDLQLRLDSNTRLNAENLEAFLKSQLAGVQLLADRLPEEAAARDADMASLLLAYPSALRVLAVGSDGHVLAARDARGRSQSVQGSVVDTDWFKAARDKFRVQVSDVYRNAAYGNETVVTLSAPLLRNAHFSGALAVDVPVDSFARVMADSLLRRNLSMLLLDGSNRVIYAQGELRWGPLDQTAATGVRLRNNAASADKKGQVLLLEGVLQGQDLAYVSTVSLRNGWVLALVAPRSALFKPLLPRLLLLAVLVVVTLLGLGLALWQQRQLLHKSIGFLLASLRGYALGGRMNPAQVESMPDELQPLAQGIGDLGDRMNAAYAELQDVLDRREQEITERTMSLREAVANLDRISRTDALTGCLNYRGFIEAGDKLWTLARETAQPLSILALDIDHFKLYNDLYGHAEGDSVLRRFAGAVRSALLHSDDVLARPGGEEFTVFLPNTTHEQAMHVGARVVQRVRDADIAHAGSLKGRLTVSVGVATLEPDDLELEDILKRADAALYRAKGAGRDGFCD